MSDVLYVTVGQVPKCVELCIVAQSFMPDGKRFGAMVWGPSGIGKNGVTDKLNLSWGAKLKQDWGFLECNVSAMAPEDLTGLPHKDLVNGKTVYFPPWKLASDSKGIFRADEIDRPSYYQNLIAVVKYAIDRTSDNPLPLNWFFLGMGNGSSDTHTQELSGHLKGRLCHIYVTGNSLRAKEEFKNYIEKQDWHPAVKKLALLTPVVTPDEFESHAAYNSRTIDFANCILKASDFLKKNGADYSEVLLPCLSGVIGKFNALQLLKIHELEHLPSLDEVIANPDTTTLLNGSASDLALQYKYVQSLVYEAMNDCDKSIGLIKYLVRLPKEVTRYHLDVLVNHCPEVLKSPEYHKWMNRNK